MVRELGMLVANRNIWETKIQTIDALLTAAAAERKEVYYLATTCQVEVEPVWISVSPNPEYPICRAIEASGYFGLNFLADAQGAIVARCTQIDRNLADKLAAMGLTHELTPHGTPLLYDCIQAIECRLVSMLDTGDHRLYIGEMTDRRVRPAWKGHPPRRFGGSDPSTRRWVKAILCQAGVHDLAMAAQRFISPPASIEEGTRRLVGHSPKTEPGAGTAGAFPSAAPAPAAPPAAQGRREEHPLPDRTRAPSVPGICLVGCGWWGSVHAHELMNLGPRIRRYFASRDPSRAGEFAHRFDGEAVSSFEAALADPRVHAVLLCLPHDLHARAAAQALAAGKHALVEKPLALATDEGERLVHQADSSGLCLAVAEQYRLSPLVAEARLRIQQGLLGRVILVHAGAASIFRPDQPWKQKRDSLGGGVWMDVGGHYVDVLRHWFGHPDLAWAEVPPHIHQGFEGEDSICVVLRFPGGPVASLQISWAGFRSPEAPNLEVIGERGSLSLWFRRPYLLHVSPLPSGHWSRRLKPLLPWRLERRVHGILPQARRARIRVRGSDLIGSRALIEDFVRAITTGAQPAVTGAEGLRDLRVVLAAYESVASGRPVPITDR
jgi:predicted dehydrogenase